MACQHRWLAMALGWMVQRSKGGGPGAARTGGHERSHLPQGHRPAQACARKARFCCIPVSPSSWPRIASLRRKSGSNPRSICANSCVF